MKKSEKFIVGVVMVAFIIFLALFSIYESNLIGEEQQNPNVSGTTGNMDLYFIENMVYYQDAVDMPNITLTKENILKLNN
jgi:uncharacterized protein (DUF305 family)